MSNVLNQTRPGVALLLALLVLSAVLTASLAASTLVLRELKASGISDRGVVVYYAAESGLEQGLYLLRQEQKSVADLVTGSEASPESMLASQAGWWRAAVATQPELVTTIRKGEVVQLDLFDPASSLSGQPQLDRLVIRRTVASTGPEWLEVASSGWTGNQINFTVTRRYFGSSDLNSGVTLSLAAQVNYRVSLRALYADIKSLQIKAYASDGSVYELPGRITVTATAELSDTKQALSITVPQQTPQASVFDYTIFSESSLCKGIDPCN